MNGTPESHRKYTVMKGQTPMWKEYKTTTHPATETVTATPFDIEKWIYEGKKAYPMVNRRTYDDPNFQGSMGAYFQYEPTMTTTDGEIIITNGDYIIHDTNGNDTLCKKELFNDTYKEVNN